MALNVKRLRRRTPQQALDIALERWFKRGIVCLICHGKQSYIVDGRTVTCQCYFDWLRRR
jgi:hypothetical protein